MSQSLKSRRALPDQSYLRECFRCENGRLYWRSRPRSHFETERAHKIFNTRYAQARAGSPMSNGYRAVALAGSKFLEHRVIYKLINGAFDEGMIVDHIDQDHTNNSIHNLRLCTPAMNHANRPGWSSRRLPKNVHWSKSEQKYKVSLRANGNRFNIGTYENLADAEAAAAKARRELHGQFAFHGAGQ